MESGTQKYVKGLPVVVSNHAQLSRELREYGGEGRIQNYQAVVMCAAATALEYQALEIERLRLNIAEYNEHERCYQSEIAALKAQPSGVVLPERWSVPRPVWKDVRQPYGDPLNKSDIEAAGKFNLALDEVARLNSSPVSAGEPVPATIGLTEYTYREALKTLREVLDPDDWMGETSMHAIIDAALSAPSHSEQVREVVVVATKEAVDYLNANSLSSIASGSTCHRRMRNALALIAAPAGVPEGWRLVPIEPTEQMICAFHNSVNIWMNEVGDDQDVYKAMLSAAPPAPAATALDAVETLITGKTVSVDVSMGDDDYGRRIFATVIGVQEDEPDGFVILCDDPNYNHTPSPDAELVELLREAREGLENVGLQDSYINYDAVWATKARIDAKLAKNSEGENK